MTIEATMKTTLLVATFLGISFCMTPHPEKAKPMEPEITLKNLPTREGNRPETTNTNPHTQLNQQPEDLSHVQDLMQWAFALGHIERRPSAISVPGAVAMCMESDHTCDRCNAFMVGTEFAHFHPHPDYSMHLGLPKRAAEIIIDKGWGEWHPLIQRGILPPNIIMMYAPRTSEELQANKFILKLSYDFAQGELE
ncbi:MAG: phospholipase [Salibacteraceae bacterium]|mgnify:CR=1 FL=1